MIHTRLQFLPFTMCLWPSSLSRNLSQPIISEPLHVNDLSVQVRPYARQEYLSENVWFLDSSLIRQEYLSGNVWFLYNPRQLCNLDERSTDSYFQNKCYGATTLAFQKLANWTFRSREFVDLHFSAFTACLTSKPCKPDRHDRNERPDK